LGSGVTVLSSDDPVRVFQRFSTVDALSNGRAEITAGRGSFIESFPLFGYDLQDYGNLFEEKLELLVELLKERPVTWSGQLRAPLNNQEVYPKSESGAIPLRVGVGGTPESVVRAARLNLHLALAIIGGDPARFAPFAQLYHQAMSEFGHVSKSISIHSPGYVAETDEEAIETHWPNHFAMFGRIGRERGWAPMTKDHFLQEVQNGSLYVGSPETVAKKIAYAVKSVGANRFDFKYANGPQTQAQLMKCLELYGTKVIPIVRDLLA
jgi:alkanesulfonate monooxygenase SsuD/methylene tetrahydromethanopterin reductase-like flavin-dependent oxidoreductase (luciferase family)